MELSSSRPWRPRWPAFAARAGTRRRGNRAEVLTTSLETAGDVVAGDDIVLAEAPSPSTLEDRQTTALPLAIRSIDSVMTTPAPASPVHPSLQQPGALPAALVASRRLLERRDDDGVGLQIA